MSQIIETILNDVCLDSRIPNGIFRIEEDEHMAALRDYLIKRGLTKEAVTHISNQMVEGLNYGDRQMIRREDGIIVTWPSPKHMAKAIKENPGKYVDETEAIRLGIYKPKEKSSGTTPKEPIKREVPKDKEDPEKEEPKDGDDSAPRTVGNIFDKEPGKVTQGNNQLDIEPPRGAEATPAPAAVAPVTPKTPERIAAEKEIAQQIIGTDNHSLANIDPPLSEICRRQLNELYKKADEMGFKEAITFLTPYVKS